jgi:hypothetical protein
MQTFPDQVQDRNGNPIPGSRALLFGNNASWDCVRPECDDLLGNRTGDNDFTVACGCGYVYDIQRAPNRNGNLNLGRATGVRCRNV